jgi:RNA-directed DNA polymerase
MRLPDNVIKRLNLDSAAESTVSSALLQMPHLISDRCLTRASKDLAAYSRSTFRSGHFPVMETIAMPKKGLGPRPVDVMSPEGRTMYQALVDSLAPDLPAPSRDKGWAKHELFGMGVLENEAIRIVDFDIAACYQYIDHKRLGEELVMHTLDAEVVQGLMDLLADLYPKQVGIPQATAPSHLLADTYLEIIERAILREGHEVHRFADDFRIITEGWGAAHAAIERASEISRENGLVLADGKTLIRSQKQIGDTAAEIEAAFEIYRAKATTDLTYIEFGQVGYDDFELVETAPNANEVDAAALTRIVEDWVTGDREKRSIHARFGSRALQALQKTPDRLPEAWLVEIATREPIRLVDIARYLSSRPEMEANWTALAQLTHMPRQSPWAKMWIAKLADQFETVETADRETVITWARQTVNGDRHEVVRAEVAWFLANHSLTTIEDLARLYVRASDVTKVGLAACAGAQSRQTMKSAAKAIRNDTALTKAAFDWGVGLEI